jgi:hypothetical protein
MIPKRIKFPAAARFRTVSNGPLGVMLGTVRMVGEGVLVRVFVSGGGSVYSTVSLESGVIEWVRVADGIGLGVVEGVIVSVGVDVAVSGVTKGVWV